MRAQEQLTAIREAEMALLGSILIYPDVIGEVRQAIHPQDFADHRFRDNLHTRIYEAMLSCQHPDQITVAREMNRRGTLRRGDCTYLCRLVAEVPCPLDYMYYAQAVAEYSLKRKLQYHTAEGNYDKARMLLDKKAKPHFRGGIQL